MYDETLEKIGLASKKKMSVLNSSILKYLISSAFIRWNVYRNRNSSDFHHRITHCKPAITKDSDGRFLCHRTFTGYHYGC